MSFPFPGGQPIHHQLKQLIKYIVDIVYVVQVALLWWSTTTIKTRSEQSGNSRAFDLRWSGSILLCTKIRSVENECVIPFTNRVIGSIWMRNSFATPWSLSLWNCRFALRCTCCCTSCDVPQNAQFCFIWSTSKQPNLNFSEKYIQIWSLKGW